MARSKKKTPVTGNCSARSEKVYKRLRAHRERVAVRSALARGQFSQAEEEFCPWDEYLTGRDGKFRFDPDLHPEWVRK